MHDVRVAHTSSMKMIAGECSRARLNSWLTSFSLSPIHLETRSLEDTVKKVDSASVATACKHHTTTCRLQNSSCYAMQTTQRNKSATPKTELDLQHAPFKHSYRRLSGASDRCSQLLGNTHANGLHSNIVTDAAMQAHRMETSLQ